MDSETTQPMSKFAAAWRKEEAKIVTHMTTKGGWSDDITARLWLRLHFMFLHVFLGLVGYVALLYQLREEWGDTGWDTVLVVAILMIGIELGLVLRGMEGRE